MNTRDFAFRAGLAAAEGKPQPVIVGTVARWDAGVPLSAWLTWDPADPIAVSFTFQFGPGRDTTWVFGRELLASGFIGSAGLGDVRIEPWLDTGLLITLVAANPDGTDWPMRLLVGAQVVAEFLAATYRQVPLGSEVVAAPPPETAGGAR